MSIKMTMVRLHLPPHRNLGKFVHSTLPVSFLRDNKSCWSFLHSVCARRYGRTHTGGKCVTCLGFTDWWSNPLVLAPVVGGASRSGV